MGHGEEECWAKEEEYGLNGRPSHLSTGSSNSVERHPSRPSILSCLTGGKKSNGLGCRRESSSFHFPDSTRDSSTTTSDNEWAKRQKNVPTFYEIAGSKPFNSESRRDETGLASAYMLGKNSRVDDILEEHMLDESACFHSKDKIPNYVLNDSVIFPSQPRNDQEVSALPREFKDNFYQICLMEESERADGKEKAEVKRMSKGLRVSAL